MRQDGGLEHGRSVGGGEMWLDAGFTLKVEPKGLANRPHSPLFFWLQELLHTHTLVGSSALTAALS